MDCPLCAKLKREYSTESEQEARATLQLRSECFNGVRSSIVRYDFLECEIHRSRKRQLTLADALSRHVEAAHRGVDDEIAMAAH